MAKKLSLIRLATHDFNRALRIWQKNKNNEEIFKILVLERAKILSRAIRLFGLTLLGCLVLAADKSDLELKLTFINLSIPIFYAHFLITMMLFGSLLELGNYFIMNEFVRVASNRLFKFDTAWALSSLYDAQSIFSLLLVEQFRFFSSNTFHKIFGKAVAFLVNLPILVILIFVVHTLCVVGYKIILESAIWSVPFMLISVSAMFTLLALLAFILIRVNFSFTKNRTYIRWNFLWPMYRRMSILPPELNNWLNNN